MNKKQLYSQIREIRNKHFPPVLEFGCEVEHIKDKSIDRITNLTKEINDPNGSWELNLYNEHIWGIYAFRGERKTFKILGKPVTLSEILMMISKKKTSHKITFEYSMTSDGIMFLMKKNDSRLWIDLSKLIQDQPEETLLAIKKIIE